MSQVKKFEDIMKEANDDVDFDMVLSILSMWGEYTKTAPKEHLNSVFDEIVSWMSYGLHISGVLGTLDGDIAITNTQFKHEQMIGMFINSVFGREEIPKEASDSLVLLAKKLQEADKTVFNKFVSLMGLMTELKPKLPPVERHLALRHAQKKWNLIESYFKTYLKSMARYFDTDLMFTLDKLGSCIYNDTSGDDTKWEDQNDLIKSKYIVMASHRQCNPKETDGEIT